MIFLSFRFLCEINLGDFRGAKSAILIHLEALNFEFYVFLHFLNPEIYQITKFMAPKMEKTAFSELLVSPKLISRKI